MSKEGVGIGKRPAKARQWLTRAAEVSPVRERLESLFWTDMEEMGSYLSLESSGWRGVEEGTGSKYEEARDWTAG